MAGRIDTSSELFFGVQSGPQHVDGAFGEITQSGQLAGVVAGVPVGHVREQRLVAGEGLPRALRPAGLT